MTYRPPRWGECQHAGAHVALLLPEEIRDLPRLTIPCNLCMRDDVEFDLSYPFEAVLHVVVYNTQGVR